MGIFSFLFGGGKYPATSKYEAQLEKEKSDFARFKAIAAGAELERFGELKAKTTSAGFADRVSHLKNDRFDQTEEFRKEQELKALAKSAEIKGYLKFVAAGKDKLAERALESAAYKEFCSLSKTPNEDNAKRLKELKANPDVKTAVKMSASAAYANYCNVKSSDRLKRYESLSAYVKTDAFVAKKTDLLNKNRFKQSPEFSDLQELARLEKTADLKWYFAALADKRFEDADAWELTFADEFGGGRLDAKKWLNGYYWGKKTAGLVYSLADERQAFVDSAATVGPAGLTIATRPAKTQGNVWNPAAGGFVKADFDATAALVNTGDAFRQKFGKFEFKVKVSGAKAPVTDNIWLCSDSGAEINVATFGKGKGVALGAVGKGGNAVGAADDVKFSSDYFVYSLEWTAKKLTWRVNGVEVYSTTQSVPQEPMYICLSSNVVGEGDIADADMNVQWVKVYAHK